MVLYFTLGGQVGSEPFSPPGTAQVDGDTGSELVQLLRALGHLQAQPYGGVSGEEPAACLLRVISTRRDTGDTAPKQATLPLRELPWGEGALAHTGVEPLSSEGLGGP